MNVITNKFNIHNTNINIKHNILDDDSMRAAGFSNDGPVDSWIFIKEVADATEFWFEIWGDGEDDFCIEILNPVTMRPTMNNLARKNINSIMFELQECGIISGYEKDMVISSDSIFSKSLVDLWNKGLCINQICKETGKRRKAVATSLVKNGIPKSEIIARGVKLHMSPVVQIDKTTGEFIAEYESINDACKKLGSASKSKISEACNGKRKSAYGFAWKYKRDYIENNTGVA